MAMTKKKIIIIAFVFLLIFLIYQVFLKREKEVFDLVKISRGDISQEISESGQVQKGEKINLTFKNSGRIEKIYVKAGDDVSAGQELAKLETSDIEIQLEEAKTSLELAQLNLKKLLSGAKPEEIKIAQTQKEEAQVSLELAKENLKISYETALTVLDSSYPQIYNTNNFIDEFFENYIFFYDDDARKIFSAREKIWSAKEKASEYLEIAKKSSKNEDIEKAVFIMADSLKKTFDSLETTRKIIEESALYSVSVSDTDKDFLDTLKTNINTALTNVINIQQTISSSKLNVETAEKKLKEAEHQLELITSPASQIDVNIYETQIKQAQARVKLYENQIEQSKLISPIDGKIVEIKKQVGELVQPVFQDVAMVLLPAFQYEIKVNIYEENLVKINVGNPVEITLTAFPNEKFKGKVTSISPAEKIIEGVVYYEATIGFEEAPENIKPGMTADVVIQTDLKENVLILPRDAIHRKNGKVIVEVFQGGKIKEKEIEIGIEGKNDMVEIISGVEEGEEVVIRK